MGALTFTQMQTLVKRTINNRSDLDTEIAQAINNAYLQTSMIRGVILRETDASPQYFSTIAATSRYEFSSILTSANNRDVMAIYSIKDMTNGRRMKSSSAQDIEDRGSASGKPIWYAHYGTGILIHPSPDAVYSLAMRYKLRPTRLSAGTDVAVLAEEYDWAIVWAAASDMNAAIGMLDKSSFYSTKRREALEIIGVAAEVEDEYADLALAPDLS